MSENLKKFLELIASNKELEAKALACNELGEEKGKLAMLELAKECGIELTAADLEKQEEPTSRELDDDELDAVAGGVATGDEYGLCYCIAAGGGGGEDSNDGNVFGCACVAYGQGGDGRAKDANCRCYFGGFGGDQMAY
jgi:predicted ribosomally synthesized peptide with nif11-like leader